MIKGVSKQILEVTNTDNPYFDKIIFFVKPEHQSTDCKKLQKEAEAVAALKQKPPKLKLTKHQIIKTAVLSLLFTMAGCGITFIITLLVQEKFKMTVYKAFRNLIIALAIVGIIVAGSLIGFSAYRIYDYAQNSQYVVSKLGSTGDEVNKIQKTLYK